MNAIQKFDRPNTKETIIPTQWFDDQRKINIKLPFCQANETRNFNYFLYCCN